MITVENLTFDYPGTRALDSVSFRVAAGSITALVGPNGAGKTTLLRCLAALEEPVAGTIRIAGVDVLATPRDCHRLVGYLSDFFGLYDELTARQCLLHAAAIRGIPAAGREAAALDAAGRLGLADRLSAKAGTLSRGLRQRLAIAQAIVHRPRLLLLDEPASGLDPEARARLAELFVALRDEGMTLVVSSHILAELDAYSTDMLVLREGRLLAHSPVRGVAAPSAAAATLRMRLEVAEPSAQLAEILAACAGVSEIAIDGLTAEFTGPAAADERHRLLRRLLDAGVTVSSFAESRQNLQQAYLESVRTGVRQEGKE
jgi:ABC-2 type transport system ATP-binding protein